ncbi:hypothetical protein ATANTOWER_028903, partial [Ataeniobius toweri]|nr:hypothetical protein [Ataeniobius toweri]
TSGSDDYEEFNEEPGGGNYVVPVSEPHTAYNLHNPRATEDHSFQSVFSHLPKPPEPQRTSKVPTAHLSNFQDKKPVKPPVPQRTVSHLKGSVAMASGSLARRRPLPIVPQRHSSNRANQNPHVPVPTQHVQLKQSIRTSQQNVQNLDPTWYSGRITRNQAELSLREVNKDGAFLVRDSSHVSTQHPYTLMLLNQGKIYNIKIQRQNDFYFLGNGAHNTKSFLRVKEMIIHHMNTPLLLVDGTDQCSEEQPTCRLLHPAGL